MSVRTQQPQILGVPPSALARALGCIRLITAVNGANLYDAVKRQTIEPAAGASSITRVLTSKGYGARTNGTSSNWTIPIESTNFEQAIDPGKCSFLWIGIAHASTAIIVRDHTAVNGTIPIWNNASTFDIRFNATDYTGAGTWTTGTAYAVLSTASAKGASVWVDGLQIVTSSSAPGGGFGHMASPIHLSQNGDSGATYDTTTVLLAIFNKPIDDATAKRLTTNPWQLFAPPLPRSRSFTPSAAAGGGTLHRTRLIHSRLTESVLL